MTRQPAIVDLGNGKYQFIFNQEEIQRPDSENPEDTMFEYDFVEVSSHDPSSIIAALIRRTYTTNDEFALIHNFNTSDPAAIAEYENYQLYRAAMKQIVHETLGE